MIVRVELDPLIKPGHMAQAVASFQKVNEYVERTYGVTGQMFIVGYGVNVMGGTRLSWDFPSGDVFATFTANQDPEWVGLLAEVTAPDGPWVLPTSRQMFAQVA